MPELLPDLEKVIYLDCDLAVLDDLGKLYDEPMDGNLCMAVITRIRKSHTEKLNIPPEEYFNSGVLVFSPAELKRLNIVDEFKKCFEKSGIFWNYINQQKTLSELFLFRRAKLPLK